MLTESYYRGKKQTERHFLDDNSPPLRPAITRFIAIDYYTILYIYIEESRDSSFARTTRVRTGARAKKENKVLLKYVYSCF